MRAPSPLSRSRQRRQSVVGELETVVFGQGLNYKFLVALGEALAVDNYSVSSTVSGARQREGQRGLPWYGGTIGLQE